MVFADTSALIKLYVQEPGSETMVALVRDREFATSALTWAEVHATFARRHREGLFSADEHRALLARFGEEWAAMLEVALDGAVQDIVAELCLTHPLRGGDAVQLASALFLSRAGLDVTFAVSDERLARVAETEGLPVVDPSHSP